MMQNPPFVSVFKINGKPILAPIITEELRKEIQEIRNICKMKEDKLKQRKDSMNFSKKNTEDQERCNSANSYTVSNPLFPVSQLPEALDDSKNESDKDTAIDEAASIHTEINEEHIEENTDTSKDVQDISRDVNSIDLYQPDLKLQMKQLIDKQKAEYLKTMDVLKKKFLVEQQQMLTKLQKNMQNLTSTPLTNNSFAFTEDEEFTEFQTCLQSFDKTSSEKTLVNDSDNSKDKAVTKINAYVRGYLVRRLMKTIFVQELIKSIQDTLHFVFSLGQRNVGGSPIQDILLKAKLFKQLQSDLHRFNDIFHQYTTKEKMRIIANDREFRRKKIVEKRMEYLNRSF